MVTASYSDIHLLFSWRTEEGHRVFPETPGDNSAQGVALWASQSGDLLPLMLTPSLHL